MKYLKNRLIVLMLMLMIPNAWTLADNCYLSDNHHPIQIKASHVQGVPKGFTIQASINGHTLLALAVLKLLNMNTTLYILGCGNMNIPIQEDLGLMF